MKRKINVFMLVFMLTLFLHGTSFADANVDVTTTETNIVEDSKDVNGKGLQSSSNSASEQSDNVLDIDDISLQPVANPEPRSQPADESSPISDGESENTNPSEGNSKETNPKASDDKKEETPVTEVNTKADKELTDLEKQIADEKDPKKKADLEKEYNKKYAQTLGKSEKLNEKILERFTDEERSRKYYELKSEYDKIKARLDEEKLSEKDIKDIKAKLDELNKNLGAYKVPRLLDEDEKKAQKGLEDSVDVPGLNDGASEDAKEKLKAYEDAKKALTDALNPENPRPTSGEELDKLVEDFNKAQADLKTGIEKGDISPTYTEGKPIVKVYPLNGGSLGKELKEEGTYYIPDNTDLNLLVNINKDDTPQKFTFTIKPVEAGTEIPQGNASNLAFLNGQEVELKKNDDGSYSFTVDENFNGGKTFGIAQLRFNIPGFKGAFHKGFDLVMDLGDDNIVKKQFRITKKGYEDEANLNGIGAPTDKDPSSIPEIDAGKTNNAIVDSNTDKVYDFFAYLKKANTYIDKLTVNSANGESLPLSSVDITLTVPEYDGKFAEMIHKSGLAYHDLGKGRYQLKLNTKVFGNNLTKTEDGKLMLGEKEVNEANLKDVILEASGKKVYIDEEGKSHEVTRTDYLESESFKVENKKLYQKKEDNSYEELGSFDENGKLEKDGTIYELKDNKLTYYKKANIFTGKVVNTGDKANPSLTPTEKGKQVEIETKDEKGDPVKSYGGTILKDAIYDKNGKVFKEEGYTGKAGNVIIDSTGKEIPDLVIGENKIIEKDGIKTVTIDGVTYRVVTNPVFKNGYLIDGLTYKDGLSLVDKFGIRLDVEVSEKEGKYTFIRKDQDGKEEKIETGKSADNKREVKVSASEEEILVDSTNKIVDQKGHEILKSKYFYDGEKFVEFNPKSQVLIPKSKETYKNGEEEVDLPSGKKTYQGSTDKEDYYSVDENIYLKKSQGPNQAYFISAEKDKSDEILSEKPIVKIVQTLGENDSAIEKITDETDIFEAIQKAKFGLKFAGFLAGKNIIYNLHADVKATYQEPDPANEGEFIEKSIFKSEKDETKKVDKFFTLKNEQTSSTNFFKNMPKELENKPDLNFFNIFYRDITDRDRDKLIVDLLLEKAKAEKEAQSDEAKEPTEEEIKAKKQSQAILSLLDKLQKELGRLYKGAKFALVKDDAGNDKLAILDNKGEKITINRSLVWELGFNNSESALFPENKDTEIIIEDYNLDNRLVYDEIVVNDTEKNWQAYKKAFEDAKKALADAKKADAKKSSDASKKAVAEAEKNLEAKKFEGNNNYFYLDQIKDIRFGVSPSYTQGRFAPLGKNFKLKGDEIIAAIENKDKATITKDKIEYQITRDKVKGQIRIRVFNAFYHREEAGKENKFYSPAQKEYSKRLDDIIDNLDDLDSSDTEAFKKSFNGLIESFHHHESECYGVLTSKFEEMMKNVDKRDFESADKKQEALNKIKDTLKEEIRKLPIEYLDSKKGDYKHDDMRFNAIRIGLKPGITLGGPMSPEKTKKLDITSVIVPDLDIPYTDEYGKTMTNKYMYVKAEIENILNKGIDQGKGKEPKKFDKNNWNKSEDTYRQVIEEAYKRLNEKIESGDISIKDLVKAEDANKDKLAWEKYTIAKGSELDYKDLAINDKSLKGRANKPLNPWYIGEGKDVLPASDKFDEELKSSQAYKDLKDKPIDLAGYYMSGLGYDRNKYANQANYKLDKAVQAENLYGKEDSWSKKCCYGIIGHCIKKAGKDFLPNEEESAGPFGAEGNSGSDFELSYDTESTTTTTENPKVEKTVDQDSIDISDDKDKKVDFTIDVTVDKLTKDQRDLAKALEPKVEDTEDKSDKKDEDTNYNENGYYVYKNSLIIDILPDIFKLKTGEDASKLDLSIDKNKLMANGANAEFEKNSKFEEWKSNIKYFYTDDLMSEYKKLVESSEEADKAKAETLKKAIEEAKAAGKIKDNEKVKAIIAYLPDFEAPHGSNNQFTFKLTNIYVDKLKFKDYNDGIIGTNYTNHAAFGDKAKFYFGQRTVNIRQGKESYVNKYLQVLDKDGNIIDADKAEGWFKGNTKLDFGAKFNYKIEYTNNSAIVPTPGQSQRSSDIQVIDILAKVEDKGLRPVLRGFVESDLDGFEVIYKIGEKSYTKDELQAAIKSKEAKFADVTSLILKSGKKGFPLKATRNFIIPMEIPKLDAKIEDGKVKYIGKDGKQVDLGDAKDFFNLKNLKDEEKDLIAENTVENSNTVKVYLDKSRFVKVFKEFFDSEGKEILENRPGVEFEVYQIMVDKEGKPLTDKDGNVLKKILLDKDGNPLKLVANDENNFTDMIENLPLFEKSISVDKEGNITEEILRYDYQIKEVELDDYEVEITNDQEDELGFVFKVKNTRKPNTPPDEPKNPPEEPKTPPEEPKNPPEEPKNPPEEPKNPPEEPKTPPEEPEKPSEDSDHPKDKDKPYYPTYTKHPENPKTPKIPKTGAVSDFSMMYISGLLLAGLGFLRKKLEDK